MALGIVGLDIDQGEDWTAQIVVSDQTGATLNLVRPIQMDVKNSANQLVLSLSAADADFLEPTVIPPISFSPNIGLIQIHMSHLVTEALPSGEYVYDLFASVNDYGAYAGSQRIRVMAGQMIVNQRITEI